LARRGDSKHLGLHHRDIIGGTMSLGLARVTYQGFRTGERWEVVVRRPGQRLRLLDVHHGGKCAFSILRDYFADETRAADLHEDFDALTVRRFTEDWELSEIEIEDILAQIEMLRMRLRMAVARG
jgi:hypothetical protein